MEFYKLFKRRTNYDELFEWIDRAYRPEKWKLIDLAIAEALDKFIEPLQTIHNILNK